MNRFGGQIPRPAVSGSGEGELAAAGVGAWPRGGVAGCLRMFSPPWNERSSSVLDHRAAHAVTQQVPAGQQRLQTPGLAGAR